MTSHGFGAADHPSDDEDDEQDELSFMEKEYDLVSLIIVFSFLLNVIAKF